MNANFDDIKLEFKSEVSIIAETLTLREKAIC